MNDGDPPLHWDEANDPPPRDFPSLLVWLRDTYFLRQYAYRGLPLPPEIGKGRSLETVAECMRSHGFQRCDQPLLGRMERGEAWPGMRKKAEKQIFLQAAIHCYQIESSRHQALLKLALLMKSGADGMPEDFALDTYEVLKRRVEEANP